MANKEFQVRHGLVVNNNVLVANTITNNVGIGRIDAGYRLDVVGTINASNILINQASITTDLTAANNWANTVGVNANNFSGVLANNANLNAVSIGNAGNNYASILVANNAIGSNNWANTVGTAGNNYASILSANNAVAANAWANTVGTASNNYASILVANNAVGANNWANTKLANATGTLVGDLTVTGNVNAHILASSNGFVDLGPGSRPSFLEGRIYYDNIDKSLNVMNEESGFPVPLGQKEYVRVFNNTGGTLLKGKPVYATGYHTTNHQHPTVALADASDPAKYDVLGLVAADIPDNSHGYVIIRGWIGGIDTSSLTVADRFHLGYDTPGSLVTVAPEYPNYPYDIGYCVVSDAVNGYLYIDRQTHTLESLRVVGPARVGGDMTVEGDFSVLGTQVVTSTSSLAVGTQYIYLGVGDSIPAANITFTGSGLNDMTFKGHYEGVGTTNFYVRITGSNATGDYFSWSYDNFSTVEASNTLILYQTNQLLSNGISAYFQSNTGHTTGATWNASTTAVTIDAGFVTNHTDPGKYTHAGLFRDATDGTFKFFNTYDAEPAGNIDIANNTFSLGNVQVRKITADLIYAGSTEIGSQLPIAYNAANLSYDKANSANAMAFHAYDTANNGYLNSNAAFDKANSANVLAYSANGWANLVLQTANNFAGVLANNVNANAQVGLASANAYAGEMANSANAWSNTRLANTSGVTFAGNLEFPAGAYVSIGNSAPINPQAPLTLVANTITSVIPLTGVIVDATGNLNSTVQINNRNANTGITASADYIATTDDGTDTTNYIDFGINNSNYNQPSWTINGARDGYLYTSDGNLAIGTANSTAPIKSISFFTGGTIAADEVMRIQDSPNGANVGIGRTDPKYKVDVLGTINASAILVNGTPFAGSGLSNTSGIVFGGNLGISTAATSKLTVGPGGTAAGSGSLKLVPGSRLTAPEVGAFEYDDPDDLLHFTRSAISGRGLIPIQQYYRLFADGSNIGPTIADFFGTNSSIPLAASGVYEIDIMVWFQKNTAGTVTWTLTNSTTVTHMSVQVFHSPLGGYTAVPTALNANTAALFGQTAAAAAFTATGSLGNNSNHFAIFKILLENGSSTSLRLRVTCSAGTVTPRRGSFWKAVRIASTNAGTYSA